LLLLLLSAVLCLLLPRMESYLAFAFSSLSAHDVIMSLSLVIELGRRRLKSSRVQRWQSPSWTRSMTSLSVTSTTVASLSKMRHIYWRSVSPCSCFDHHHVHAGTRAPHGSCEVAGELSLELVPLIDGVLVERLEPDEWGLVQVEWELEALRVIVSTSVFNG
jgi:hypothetical protein